MKLYAVSVATHREGYYDAFVESCKQNGLELVILGYGQQWRGFAWRFLLMKDYLETLEDQDIVIFLDAYDIIATQHASTIQERFLKFNAPIVLSTENVIRKDFLFHYIRNGVFGHCPKADISGGAYMGYVYALKQMYSYICQKYQCSKEEFSALDDQRILTSLCNDEKFSGPMIAFDHDSSIFYTVSLPISNFELLFRNKFYPDPQFHNIQNQQLYLRKSGMSPCFIHGIGNTDMDFLIELYQLPPRHDSRLHYNFKIACYYCGIFKYELLFVGLIMVLMIGALSMIMNNTYLCRGSLHNV